MSNVVRAVFPMAGLWFFWWLPSCFLKDVEASILFMSVWDQGLWARLKCLGFWDFEQMRFAWSSVTILASGDRWRCCKTHRRLGVDSGGLPVAGLVFSPD